MALIKTDDGKDEERNQDFGDRIKNIHLHVQYLLRNDDEILYELKYPSDGNPWDITLLNTDKYSEEIKDVVRQLNSSEGLPKFHAEELGD